MHDDEQASQGACQDLCAAPDSPDADEGTREEALARALAEASSRQQALEAGNAGTARILLAGRAGSGRTCLAKALGGPDFVLLDAKGFGAAGDHEACVQRMLGMAEGADAVMLCVPAPDRAWGLEARFLADLAKICPETALFCAGTKIDLLPPARVWQPGLLRLDRPHSPKELAIARWQHALLAFLRRNWQGVAAKSLRLVSQGAGSGESAFGIRELKALLATEAPALVRRRLAMASADDPAGRRAQAERLVWKSAAAAAAAAAVPIPFAEAAFLAPLQIGMCASLARLYGQDLSRGTAARMLAPALAGFIGRIGLVSLLDFVPGPGSLAGSLLAAGIAGPATLAVGEAFTDCLERSLVQPGCAEMARLVRERYRKALLRKDELLRKAKKVPRKAWQNAQQGEQGQQGQAGQSGGGPVPEAGRGGQP